MILELEFDIRGQRLPADHGYALYSAVKQIADISPETLLSSIPGQSKHKGIIALTQFSKFRLRTPNTQIDNLHRLLNQQVLDIRGHLIKLIDARLSTPKPSAILKSRLVTIKLAQVNLTETPNYFLESCQRALDKLEIQGKVSIDYSEGLALKAIRIKEKHVLGYAVTVENLNVVDSIKLQTMGLGGRKHFGCGWFYAPKEVK